MIKNIVIGVTAVAALVVGILAYNKQAEPILGAVGPMGPMGLQGPVGPQGPAGKSVLGALSSPDLPYNYISVGGLAEYRYSRDFTRSTTTVCAIQAPAATSSLAMAGALVTTASTSATTWTIAKAATAFATTTVLGQGAIAANGQGFLLASTTATSAGGTGSNMNPAFVFGPNQWLVVGVQGGVGNFSPVGECVADFFEIE